MKSQTTSERQELRDSLDWILDLKQKDVDAIMRAPGRNREDPSMKLIYEDLGIEYCIGLWRSLLSVTLYISETRLNDLRRHYVRLHYDVNNPQSSAKELAVRLGASEKFVYESLAADDGKADPRQAQLFT